MMKDTATAAFVLWLNPTARATRSLVVLDACAAKQRRDVPLFDRHGRKRAAFSFVLRRGRAKAQGARPGPTELSASFMQLPGLQTEDESCGVPGSSLSSNLSSSLSQLDVSGPETFSPNS
jgi:hypothetical protein